jgi:hypothetical protein
MARMKGRPSLVNYLLEIQCMDAEDLEAMTPEQANALHHFKYKLAASLYRLYTEVPEELVEKIFADKAKKVAARLSKF